MNAMSSISVCGRLKNWLKSVSNRAAHLWQLLACISEYRVHLFRDSAEQRLVAAGLKNREKLFGQDGR